MSEEAKDKQDEPKIIIDDDWKAQAQAEKEKLAADEAAQADEGGPAGAGERQIPPASFEVMVSTLVTQAMFALGAIEDPASGKRFLDLDLAKHHIDMLSVLEAKTKGNLDDDESKLIDQALYESRMHYVQVANAVANQMMGAPGGQPPQPEGTIEA